MSREQELKYENPRRTKYTRVYARTYVYTRVVKYTFEKYLSKLNIRKINLLFLLVFSDIYTNTREHKYKFPQVT